MSLFDPSPTTVVLPGQLNGSGAYNETYIEAFNGVVERAIEHSCFAQKLAKPKTVRGAQTITKRSSGPSTIQKMTRGEAPAGTTHQFGTNKLTVDTMLLCREAIWNLDEIQNDFDALRELAWSQGVAYGEAFDEAYFIQALKAAKATSSPYGTAGFQGGTQVTVTSGSEEDPAALMTAITKLIKGMMQKKVVPQRDGVALYMPAGQFTALMNSELVMNGEYITSRGTKFENIPIYKAYGIPCFSTENIPFGKVITGHKLSNSDNSNAYDGDFENDIIVAVSEKAVFAGQSIPVQSKIYWDERFKSNFVDTWGAYGMTTDRTEYAGVISIA